MERVADAEAHSEVLAELTSAIIDQAMAAVARLELLNENRAKLSIDLRLHTHAAQHRNDTSLRTWCLLGRWDELLRLKAR